MTVDSISIRSNLVYIMSCRACTFAAILIVVALLTACGGEDEQLQGFTTVDQLEGGTIGVFDFDDTSTLSLRYVLQETYGLTAASAGGDVTLVELPGPDLLPQLADGEVDAVILPEGRSFGVYDADSFRELANVTDEMRTITKLDVANSILLTYSDLAEQKADGLYELNRMLAASATYAEANRSEVIDSIAEDEAEAEVARRWWDVRSLLFGDTSEQVQEEIMGVWSSALSLGDIADAPNVAELMRFDVEGEVPGIEVPENGDVGDRVAVSVGVLDDVSRRVALYAIEQAIVESDLIDVRVSYVSRSGLTEAVSSREFDVVEASPLAVPLGAERDLEFVIVSGGERNRGGTLLIVAND